MIADQSDEEEKQREQQSHHRGDQDAPHPGPHDQPDERPGRGDGGDREQDHGNVDRRSEQLLRRVGHSGKGEADQGRQVVLGASAGAGRLVVRHRVEREAAFHQHPAKERLRVPQLFQAVDHHVAAVIEAKASEAPGITGSVAKPIEETVADSAEGSQQERGVLGLPHGQNDLRARPPAGDELADQLWRILEIGRDAHNGAAIGLIDASPSATASVRSPGC